MRSRPVAHAAVLALLLCAAASTAAAAHNLLMIPGPVEFSDPVLAAAGGLPMSHMDKGFAEEFGQALEMLRKVFLTERGQPFVIAGSGTLGWDIVGSNLVERGDRVLLLNSGYFGDRFADSLNTFGVDVTEVRAASPGSAPTLEQIETALTDAASHGHTFKAVTITHVDTSTGVWMDVKAIAALVHRLAPNALVVVDGVCSAGAEELRMDAWGVDFVLTASQKALGTPPGLCVVVASQRALKSIASRSTPVSSYYASLPRWLPIMQAYEARAPKYFATPPVQLVQALRESLAEILGPGDHVAAMEARFQAHVTTSNRVKDKVESWGFDLVTTSREVEAHTLTAIRLPNSVDPASLLPRIARRGVVVAGGLLPSLKYFRIGHMHLSATHTHLSHIDTTLAAVNEALKEEGYKGVDAAETAAKLKAAGWQPRIKVKGKEEL